MISTPQHRNRLPECIGSHSSDRDAVIVRSSGERRKVPGNCSGPREPKHESNPATDMHAGESETSMSMIARPDLVHLDRAPQESGADQARVKLPEGLYTGIWWYARFPNHYAGEGAAASRELGEFEAKTWINGIVQAIRAVKADQESLRLQHEFYERSKHPLDTPQ